MLSYLLTARKFFASNRPYSQRAVAAEADVHEDVVGRWHKVPGFDEWFGAEMFGECDRMLPLAAVACVRRVIRTGDPKELETILRVRGKLPAGYLPPAGDGEGSVPAVGTFVLNLLVPRPDMPVLNVPALKS